MWSVGNVGRAARGGGAWASVATFYSHNRAAAMATPSQSASLVENFDTSLSLHEPLANVVTSLLADEEAQAAAVSSSPI